VNSVQGSDLAPFVEDLNQSETLSEIKPPLLMQHSALACAVHDHDLNKPLNYLRSPAQNKHWSMKMFYLLM
jgi:hypothetical protein